MHLVVLNEAVVVIRLGLVRWAVDLSERGRKSSTDATYVTILELCALSRGTRSFVPKKEKSPTERGLN